MMPSRPCPGRNDGGKPVVAQRRPPPCSRRPGRPDAVRRLDV